MEKEIYKQIHRIEETHWWYVARRKIIFDWINMLLVRYKDPRILDVGCGTGYNLNLLKNIGCSEPVGLDISLDALNYCHSRNLTQLICGDSVYLPFKHGSFDVILALDLIEHLDDDLRALSEFHRLLSVNGKLVLFTPAFNFLWGKQDEVGHHRRRYTTSDLNNKISNIGLSIIKISYTNTFLFPLIFGGRLVLRFFPLKPKLISENDLSPQWANGTLTAIFQAEKGFLRRINFPFGVSILCIAEKLN
jgi:SAM-dependent methyltransferase